MRTSATPCVPALRLDARSRTRLAGVVTMTAPTPDADGHTVSPDVGAVVVDRRNGKVGVVMGHVGPYVQLRPPRGGREWDVPPEDVRQPLRRRS